MTLTSDAKVGLIGWPVEHSLSPAMHNAAFEALGMGWRYGLIPVPPGQLGAVLEDLRTGEYVGVNVTVPHKCAVMAHLDEIDDAARSIGAVNTIAVRGKRLLGYNTDAPGLLRALREAGTEPSGGHALVLGAGGAARAAAYALAQAGCTVAVYNRTTARAVNLVRHMRDLNLAGAVDRVPDEEALRALNLAEFDLLVNATPVGMWPECDDSPWTEGVPLPSHWTVLDLVYNPLETRLLRDAQRAGARTIGGLGMLVCQGALAFELWTGCTPPADLMRAAALEALGIER